MRKTIASVVARPAHFCGPFHIAVNKSHAAHRGLRSNREIEILTRNKMDIHNVEDSVDEKNEKKVLNFHQMELDDRILKVI